MLDETSEWDRRLMCGLTGVGAPAVASDTLVQALGALGCEAEFGLALLQAPARLPRPTLSDGIGWLRQCLGLCQRLMRVSRDLEAAAQSFCIALSDVEPDLAAIAGGGAQAAKPAAPRGDLWAAQFDALPTVWWPEPGAVEPGTEPVEWWLRRAGFAYRHCMTLGLPEHLEALTDGLSLALHALRALPPRGVVSRASLYLGVQALATEIAGDLVPHHIVDLDTHHIGLVTASLTLLHLHAEPAPLSGDIAWARAELDRARAMLGGPPAMGSRVTRPLTRRTGNLWARQLVAEWERTLARLEALRSGDSLASPASSH
jgi:hypothetical protein